MPLYQWAPVLPAQIVDDVAINALGAAVTAHDAALSVIAPYRARQILSGTAATVVFSNIPTNLARLECVYTARGDAAGVFVDVFGRINGDSSALYSHAIHFQTNNTAGAGSTAAQTFAQLGTMAASGATAGKFGGGRIDFIGWDSPHASCLIAEGNAGFVNAGGACVNVATTFQYLGAGPYTSITLLPFTGNFVAGSDFQLVGYPS